MGFVYRVAWVLKALWIILSETINILRKLQKITFSGCPPKFYHILMYIAPSSGHILLNLYFHFKFILLKEVWGCFLMSGVRMLHFLKDWWKFIQIHQYYTMALRQSWIQWWKMPVSVPHCLIVIFTSYYNCIVMIRPILSTNSPQMYQISEIEIKTWYISDTCL